jgi:hypothetical protein
MSTDPNKILRTWDPSIALPLVCSLSCLEGTLCFALINLFLLKSPLCLCLNSFSYETKNFLGQDPVTWIQFGKPSRRVKKTPSQKQMTRDSHKHTRFIINVEDHLFNFTSSFWTIILQNLYYYRSWRKVSQWRFTLPLSCVWENQIFVS